MIDPVEFAVLGALAAARVGLPPEELLAILERAGVDGAGAAGGIEALARRGFVVARGALLDLSAGGIRALLDGQAALQAVLDPDPVEECPSIPWLTTVKTCWIDAVSLNYAVPPSALSSLLPPPLLPEVWKGSAWVQVLVSSLRDMRPQGLGALFGVCFYQVSYRAAVRFRRRDGEWRRGGYFVRSETNHPVMRAVGNALVEFRFHDFGAAEMVMLRDGDRLNVGIDAERPGGKVVAVLDTRPLDGPSPGSVWRSVDELHEPLVECYDALGVDRHAGWMYTLTIERDPWNPRFVRPESIYCEFLDGMGRLDSVLHFAECAYRWRPLRREPLP